MHRDCHGAGAFLGCWFLIEEFAWASSDDKTQCVDGFSGDLTMWYIMEAVTTPLGYIKERQVEVDRPPAMHHDYHGAGAFLGCWFWFWGSQFWRPQTTKHSALMAFLTMWYFSLASLPSWLCLDLSLLFCTFVQSGFCCSGNNNKRPWAEDMSGRLSKSILRCQMNKLVPQQWKLSWRTVN